MLVNVEVVSVEELVSVVVEFSIEDSDVVDDVVDKNRIGAVGISWGSVILSIALGYNNNFSFAINVYGSGYLTQSLSFMRYKFILPVVAPRQIIGQLR